MVWEVLDIGKEFLLVRKLVSYKKTGRVRRMKKKLMALMLSGVLVLQSAGMAYGADFSDGTGVEVCGKSEEFSDSDGNTAEEQFSGGLDEEEKVQEEAPDGENEQNAESATASLTYGTCGKNLKWELDNGTLTISGIGEMTDYNALDSAPWDFVKNDIKKIEIKAGVTRIGNWAFYGCGGLMSITIPSSVMSIGNHVFTGCSKLTDITIPNGVTSIEDWAFDGCIGLTRIIIPNSVMSIGDMAFYACGKLTSITIPSRVENIGDGAFEKCIGLTKITIPDNVTSIGAAAFAGCIGLTSITIPNRVENIEFNTFKNCSGLRSIRVTNSITNIESGAFYGCNGLKDVYYEGDEAEWKKIYINTWNESLKKAKIHYKSSAPSYDKKFSLKVSNGAVVFGRDNALFVEYEAYASGMVASEGKQIKWESSNPSVAEIDQKSTGLIVSQDDSSGSGWINLLTYDVGRTVITGTSVDGRKASVEVEVEPELGIAKNSVSILKETLVTLCSVKLERANKEYLESFMKSLKATVEGSVTIRDTRYIISEDGKLAEFAGYVNVGTEDGYVICTSKGGQAVRLRINRKTSTVAVPNYNYEAVLKKWMNDEGTENSINYLISNKNYINTLMVSQTENSYLGEFVENTSELVFGGLEGWKNYWKGTTKREEARKILAGLLTNYNDEVETLSMAETAKEFADAYLSALKKANWAYAIEYGLNSEEIEDLYELCSEDHIENFFLEGNYNDLSKYLALLGGYGEDSRIIKCIQKFTESDEAIESVSKKMKFLGDGLTVLKLSDSTIKKYYEIEALSRADQRYCEMLLYLKQNCSYVPVQQAADDLYNVVNNELKSQGEYLTKEITDEVEERIVDIILEKVTARIPMAAVIYNSYKYSVDFANLLFDTADAQKQSDNMRCVAYIGTYLSEWLKTNKATYISSSGNAKNEAAKKTVFAYYMLLETRMKGEESCRKFMELIKFKKGSRQYNVSLEITSTLESIKKLLKSNGVLMNQYLSSVVACPVDIMVCDSFGNDVLTVHDGKTSSGTVNGIYYNVYYNALEQDYVKVINLPLKGGYILKCVGNDLGKVNISVSSISEDGSIIRKDAGEIPVKKGSQIQVDNISGPVPVCKLEDKDGNKKEYPVQEEKQEYIAVSSIKADQINMKITAGEKKIINLTVSPENATNKGIEWSSEDTRIATVNTEGVVTGVSAGTTTIRAITVEKSGVYVDITIKVTNNGTDITPTPESIVTPTEKPQMPKLENIIPAYNAITFKWGTVSNADGYQVYRKVNSGKWKSVKTTTGLVYKDKDTKAGYKYSYTVKAYKLIDGKKVYSGYDKIGLSGKLNTTVSLKIKNNTVSVSWKKTNGASGYYIYRATSKKGKYSKIKIITSGKTLKYTDKKVKKGKTYYYKVVPFRKISGKAVKGASSAVKSIAFKKKDVKPTESQSSAWKYPEAVQKLIDYLIKNGQEWTDSSNGTDYTIDYLDVGNGSITLQYQKARGDQKSMLWMAYSVNEEINSQNREVITLSWCEVYQLDNSKGEISVNYRINNNDNSVEGKMAANDFTKETNVRFYGNTLKDYTLEQMSEKGNKLLQEALPLFESCLKQGDSGVALKDLGFKKYNFH